MSNTLIDSLKGCTDSVLGVRDSIGAVKAEARIVTRTWSGSYPGDGTFTDSEVRILPSPHVVDLSNNVRLIQAGVVQLGDIELRSISKNKYPDKTVLDSTSPSRNVEKFYRLGESIYQIIMIREKYLTWSVMLRKTTDQTRNP